MIRRKKVTIFTDAKETTSLGEVKKIIEGVCKVEPENQKLFKDDQVRNSFLFSNTGLSCIPGGRSTKLS